MVFQKNIVPYCTLLLSYIFLFFNSYYNPCKAIFPYICYFYDLFHIHFNMFLCINYSFDIMFMVMKIDCQENIQIKKYITSKFSLINILYVDNEFPLHFFIDYIGDFNIGQCSND